MSVNTLTALALIFLSSGVQSTELYQNWVSARALGMGNAYTAVVQDADSLFYNPAGLGRVTGIDITVLDAKVAGDSIKSYQKLTKLKNEDAFASTLQSLYGDEVSAVAGAKSAIVAPYFGAVLYDSVNIEFEPQNPASTNVNLNATDDFGYGGGFAFSIGPFVQGGLALKHVHRLGVRQVVGSSVIGTLNPTTIENSLLTHGTGYDLDSGVNILIPGPTQTVISGTWRNIGVTQYTPDNVGDTDPPADRDEIAVGGAMTFHLPLLTIMPAVDVRYLNWSSVQITKKINFGVEMRFPFLTARAGFSQGYYSVGLGVDLGLIHVDAATYGVELGEAAGQMVDRRYIAQVTIDLGFEVSKSSAVDTSHSSSGSDYKLKQRR